VKKHIRKTLKEVLDRDGRVAADGYISALAAFGPYDIAVEEGTLKMALEYLRENPEGRLCGSRYTDMIASLEDALGMTPPPERYVEVRADDLQAILQSVGGRPNSDLLSALARIKESLDTNGLEPDCPMEEVDAEIRAQGGDPEGIKARAEKIQGYVDSERAMNPDFARIFGLTPKGEPYTLTTRVLAARQNREVHAELLKMSKPFFCDNCKAGPCTENDAIICAEASKVPEAQTTLDRVRNKILKENRERRNPVGGKNLKPTTPRPDVQPVASKRGPK
jgi:hypothetical protein